MVNISGTWTPAMGRIPQYTLQPLTDVQPPNDGLNYPQGHAQFLHSLIPRPKSSIFFVTPRRVSTSFPPANYKDQVNTMIGAHNMGYFAFYITFFENMVTEMVEWEVF